MKNWKAWAAGGILTALGFGLFVSKKGTPIGKSGITPLQKGPMRFVRAANFTVPPTPRDIKWIVIHTIESPEDKNRAYNLGVNIFARPDQRKSTHYGADSDEVVQYVDDSNIAWGAEGANGNGLHVEHAGVARQSAEQWNDAYSLAMLERSAELTANKARKYNIPIRKLSWQEMKAGERGFVGHVDVNLMRRNGGPLLQDDHSDPGPNFPWDWYLSRVKAYYDAAPNADIA